MPSVRLKLLDELVTRIAGIPDFGCQLRRRENAFDSKVSCIVFPEGEDKEIETTESYNSTYQAEVVLICDVEDADDTLDGDGTPGSANPYRYLDRNVVEVEKIVHTPDEWESTPGFDRVTVTGHVVEDPSDQNEVAARIFIEFKYRHNYQDPTT